MATITPKLTLTGTAADFGNVISLEATTNLTIIEPFVGFSRITATTTGNESNIVTYHVASIILWLLDGRLASE